VAGVFSKIDVFQGIPNLDKENLSTEELNKMILATDNEGSAVYNMEADFSKIDLFQRILNLAEKI
jgi:hypothetical protein